MASAATLGILIKTDDKASPGLQKIGGAAGQMGRTFQNNSKVIGASMTAIGASIVAASVLSIKSFMEMGDEVHKMALRTGFTTERLSELKFAAEQSGTGIGSIDKAVKTMNKALIDADRGLETYARSFRELGLTTEELLALSPEEQFNTIAIALSELEDQTKKSAIAQEVFGRTGTQLLPMLAAGADGIAALSQEARDLGIVLDQEAADAAAKMTDDMNSLSKAMDGIKFQIAQALLPIINDLVEQITAAITSVKDWAAENPGLADTITKVGLAVGVLGVALGPVVLALPIIVTALPLLKAGLVALVSPLGKVKLAAVAVGAAIAVIIGKTTELGDLAKALGGTAKALDGTAKPYVSAAPAVMAEPIGRVIGQGLQMGSELAAIEAVALGPYYERAELIAKLQAEEQENAVQSAEQQAGSEIKLINMVVAWKRAAFFKSSQDIAKDAREAAVKAADRDKKIAEKLLQIRKDYEAEFFRERQDLREEDARDQEAQQRKEAAAWARDKTMAGKLIQIRKRHDLAAIQAVEDAKIAAAAAQAQREQELEDKRKEIADAEIERLRKEQEELEGIIAAQERLAAGWDKIYTAIGRYLGRANIVRAGGIQAITGAAGLFTPGGQPGSGINIAQQQIAPAGGVRVVSPSGQTGTIQAGGGIPAGYTVININGTMDLTSDESVTRVGTVLSNALHAQGRQGGASVTQEIS